MKYIKSFNESVKGKKELNSSIIQYKDYKEVKKVAVGIYNRLSKLYPITGVDYDHKFYDNEMYKDKLIPLSNYRLVLYLD